MERNKFSHNTEKGEMQIGLILALFASLSYLMDYVSLPLVTLFSLLFLLTYYIAILLYHRIEYYFVALLVYRPFVELLFPFGENMTLGLLFIVFLPLPLYFLFAKNYNFKSLKERKFLILFLAFSFFSGYYFQTFSLYIFQNRYLSLLILLFIGIVYNRRMNFRLLLKMMRVIFVVSLLVYLFPNYGERTEWLVGTYGIFGDPLPVEEVSFIIPRNHGFYFDCRLMGLFSVVYFVIALLYKGNPRRKMDIFLSLVVLFTTMSRGAMVLGLFVYIGYVLEKNVVSIKHIFKYLIAGCVVVFVVIVASFYFKPLADFLDNFNPFSETGAVSQRMIFIGYGFSRFLESPIWGNGAGALKGFEEFDWGELFIGGENYHKETYITDSFLTSTLAEIGIIGFILFFMYQRELLFNKSIFSVILIIGLFAQMFGTDIPDIGIQYAFILYVLNSIINDPSSITFKQNK